MWAAMRVYCMRVRMENFTATLELTTLYLLK